ncbi:hypothetical protein C8F04DRAFT_279755 [Mycena alexandri]|uniref:F-box domain-containing protein n=1 Tax=Mycena alexandri TaxID=1745969 RepID=A0AAD6T6E0_9AGAR|nr:hypothetical protein C8F04DRAFT_279755 [Mycena alexandri]
MESSSLPLVMPYKSIPYSNISRGQLRQHLEEVESEILRHQMHLDALENRRRELRAELGNIVYPVLTLPSELVSQIFVDCLPSHGRVRPKVDTLPLSLSQICRDWREIALSSCELWSSLDLLFTAGSPNDGALPLLETWFSRAKDYPLSVTIRSEDEELDPKIISLISSVAGQIQSLELQGRREDLPLFAAQHATFPRLRHLAVIHPDFASDILERIDTPSLHKLAIPGTPGSLNRYPSLTSIELGDIDERDLVDLSHQCPELLHLTASITGERVFDDDDDDDDDTDNSRSSHLFMPIHSEIITLPRLQSLNLLRGDLDLFTLPSLRRLDINPDYYVANGSDRLLAFMVRSACDLDHIGFDFDDLVKCFAVIPSVASLNVRLRLDEMIPEFQELMTADPTPLPHLRSLAISAKQENFDYLSFIQLIQARRGPPATTTTTTTTTRLESVQIEFYDSFADVDKIPASARTEFERLISGGLKLQVTCSDVTYSRWPEAMDACERFPLW